MIPQSASWLESAQAKRDSLRNQLAIHRALVGDVSPEDLSPNQAELLVKRRQEFVQSNSANEEALASSQARLDGLRQSLATAETIAQRYAFLQEVGAASELNVLKADTQVESLRSNLEAQERGNKRLLSIRDAEAARREAQRRREIEDSLRMMADLDREIRQAEVVLSDIEITAPIAGLVFDLSVQRGSVIQPSTEPKPLSNHPGDQLARCTSPTAPLASSNRGNGQTFP